MSSKAAKVLRNAVPLEAAKQAPLSSQAEAAEPAHKRDYEIEERVAGERASQGERVAPGIVKDIDERDEPVILPRSGLVISREDWEWMNAIPQEIAKARAEGRPLPDRRSPSSRRPA